MNSNAYTFSKPVRISNQGYPWPQFAVHSVSMVYNVSGMVLQLSVGEGIY